MKQSTRRYCFILSAIVLLPIRAAASNFQDFSGITYSNPAELTFLVQKTQVILGDEYFAPSPNIIFNGSVFVPDPSPMHHNVVTTGTTENTDFTTYPYGRVAQRLSKQWVVGLDVTKPFDSSIIYPNNSVARYAVTNSGMKSVDVAPNVAYQFSGKLSKLAIGAGWDAMYYTVTLDSKYPSLPTPTTPFGTGSDLSINNHATNWGYGWHAGAIYHLFQTTILGFSYFSAITQNFTNGTSSFTGFPTSDQLNLSLPLPATSNFSILQFLNKEWSMVFKVHYSQWDTLQQVTLHDISGPAPSYLINLHYKNTWRFDVGTRYDLSPKFTVGALFAYDQTPTNDADRILGLPGVNQTILGCSMGYKFTKKLEIEAQYGHMFSVKAPINYVDPNTGITTNGNVNISGNAVGLLLTFNT